MSVKQDLKIEAEISRLTEGKVLAEKKYRSLIREVERLVREREAVISMKSITTHAIAPSKTLPSEAVAVVLASDWHIEENVSPKSISGLNKFSMEIAEGRIEKFFQTTVKMIEMFKRDIPIRTLVLWLGGDFISNDIHDELVEVNEKTPIEAIISAQNIIASGIRYILEETDLKLVIPCSFGNHGRVTKKVRFSTEGGHSLENFMYHNLKRHFEGNKRVTFVISEGYHTYIDVFSYRLRFHHGHAIKYGGGIGGIFIPTFKAIGQWNKAVTANWDFFGHFHSMKDGGNFVGNGSLIGYNAYALSIKADYEKPKQAFVLIDKNRGKTIVAPIILD